MRSAVLLYLNQQVTSSLSIINIPISGKTGGNNMLYEQNHFNDDPRKNHSDIPDYDGGYKDEFSNKKHFLHFLKKYVKADWAMSLKEEDVELCDREFLLEDYQKRRADLVYRVHFKDTPELERQRKDFRLLAVISILFYNGEDPWSAEREFRKYIRGYERFGTNMLNDLSSTEKTEFIKWTEHVLLPGMSKQYREQALQLFQNRKGGNDDNMMHWIQKQQGLDYERMWENGLSQGQERINRLNALLLQDHRQEDLMRSVSDPTFQEQLIKEYCLDT
jgi:hypothetical protein